MGLRINTNLASLAAQRQISLSQRNSQGALKALASGNRFDDPSQGSADYTIAEHLRGQIAGMKAAVNNAANANSFVQVAEGGLNEQNNILIRMRELAIQSASDTYSDNEREMLEMEYSEIAKELDRIAHTTSFGTAKVLSGESREYEFQVGAYAGEENIIRYTSDANTTASALGVSGTGVSDKSEARDALESIDDALDQIGQARASFGAMQRRLDSVVNHGESQVVALEGARSRMGDTDVAEAVSAMYKAQALQQYQLAVLNQANQQPLSVLKLIA